MRAYTHWKWRLDEVYVKINGEMRYLFDGWIEPMLQSIHRQGYRAPNIRRVYIPKPGKTEKRPLGVPTVADRALQRTSAEVLTAICAVLPEIPT